MPHDLHPQFPILRREINGKPLHYLDNAATTFSPDCVLQAMADFEIRSRSNIQRGMHQLGLEATEAYEKARCSAANYLNAPSTEEIVFTPGTTFAVNMVAHCFGQSLRPGDEIVVSVAEHHSNFVPWQRLRDQYEIDLRMIPVKANGNLDLDNLEQLITDRCRLVAVSHISNVTGSITDLERVTAAAHRHGALVFVDGAQAVPHGPVDVQSAGADFYAFSAHKCYGTTGVGVLWARQEILQKLPPFLTGGGMVERVTTAETRFSSGRQAFEAGTPPVVQAIGLGAALDWLQTMPWAQIHQYERGLSGRLLQGLADIDGLKLLGETSPDGRAPIFSFDIEGCHSHDICHILNEFGVALRGGHHCAQPLMDALELVATTRASLALFNSDEDIEALLSGLQQAVAILR
jgi:cysteine desulfurase/selenocysteine lyase